MDKLIHNETMGLILIVLLVAVLIVLIIRRILRVRKVVTDALAEGVKKSKLEGEQPGRTDKP